MTQLLLAALLSAGPTRAAAPVVATPARSPELPGADAELKAADGWVLHGRYLAASDPTRLTLVLLHGRGMRKESWLRLARALRKEGYGYLAMDFRGHGQSLTGPDGQPSPWRKFKATKSQNDYERMALDAQAAVAFLIERNVPEERIGLAGQDLGGSIALKYAAVHPKAPLVVMLSPGLAYQDIPIVNAVRYYKDRPILMIYGGLDKTASAAVPVLASFAQRSAGERNTTVILVAETHGNKLLTPATVLQIIGWLDDPVRPEELLSISSETAPSTVAPEDSPQ